MVLAHYISDFNTGSKRILEVGCGMALSSLLLNKKHANITATDYHPEAGIFLARNTLLNKDQPIAYKRVDWVEKEDDLGLFDLIIGSDYYMKINMSHYWPVLLKVIRMKSVR